MWLLSLVLVSELVSVSYLALAASRLELSRRNSTRQPPALASRTVSRRRAAHAAHPASYRRRVQLYARRARAMIASQTHPTCLPAMAAPSLPLSAGIMYVSRHEQAAAHYL